jgi:hypothetical protein
MTVLEVPLPFQVVAFPELPFLVLEQAVIIGQLFRVLLHLVVQIREPVREDVLPIQPQRVLSLRLVRGVQISPPGINSTNFISTLYLLTGGYKNIFCLSLATFEMNNLATSISFRE